MEEIENLSILKLNQKKYRKLKGKLAPKINQKIIKNIVFSVTIIFLFWAFIILISQNKKMKKNISLLKRSSTDLNQFKIPINYLNFNNEENAENKNKNLIHISYSLDEQLIYPTLVSMASGLDNCDSNNLIVYHLLLSYNFDIKKLDVFESLKEKYNVKLYYYIIPNIFGSSRKWTAGTDCVYYKILLPFLFPDYERMIYLDGDTLIRKDILEMYNYPFNDNYVLGFPFYMGYVMEKHGIKKPEHYINGGCLLFNIKKIRKDNKDVDLLSLTIKNNSEWRFREQDSINYVFNSSLGFLPLKYGIYMIGSNKVWDALSHYVFSPLNKTEGYEAIKDPSIVHFSCCWPKVWTNGSKNLFKNDEICLRYQKEFYHYARKTNYYQLIFDMFFYKKLEKKRR